LFAERKRLFALCENGSRRELQLESFWDHKCRIVLKFAGVDSISDAETLAGCEIQVPEEERAPLEPGVVYVSDLKDCVVAVAAPRDDKHATRDIGHVADVIFGAGEAPLLVVRETADKQSKEYLIPFAEEYVQSSDLAAKRIVMVLPEGMLELDAPLSREERQRQQEKQEE
jgi:16S rRNA processing protein RimM